MVLWIVTFTSKPARLWLLGCWLSLYCTSTWTDLYAAVLARSLNFRRDDLLCLFTLPVYYETLFFFCVFGVQVILNYKALLTAAAISDKMTF
jgi:hypothetical protein